MVLAAELQTDFINTVQEYGTNVRLIQYIDSYSGNSYDDAYLTASGTTFWTWGRIDPITSNTTGDEKKLIAAGKLLMNDSKLFLPGSYDSVDVYTQFGLGSPTPSNVYTMIEKGKVPYSVAGSTIFNKIYVRILNNGSFATQV